MRKPTTTTLKTQQDITKPETENNCTHLRHYLHKAETLHFLELFENLWFTTQNAYWYLDRQFPIQQHSLLHPHLQLTSDNPQLPHPSQFGSQTAQPHP